ncbi:hypothetical protein QN379_04285 [Glaciimonas sp. Gout2]|uniref:hypothetical protein n=1 Tax=unclassified Glaciimonas TaxID=2644401 RepID=UPI002B2300DF|nr:MULTISPECIES: hypothetical protein [unclassified Glaciimonas]MEB0011090.1 hypothetical protein [Glaciimonas sp. Cout2]MEB0081232.1 hypothetical protein [Glaciimonas sp. Gout2]
MKKSYCFLFLTTAVIFTTQPVLGSEVFVLKSSEPHYLTTAVAPSCVTEARAISANGKFVVGGSDVKSDGNCNPHAFVWSEKTGMIDINEDAAPWSWATAVNMDGTVIAGMLQRPGREDPRPFKWTAETGIVDLTQINAQLETFCPAVLSADGATMGGRILNPKNSAETRAVLVSNDVITFLGSKQKNEASRVKAMTPNGEVVVGEINNHVFRWKKGDGLKDISIVKGRRLSSYANGVSDDGSVVVGSVFIDGAERAYRWTEKEGIKNLGTLIKTKGTYDVYSKAFAVSGDGKIVYGISSANSEEENHLFRWTADTGMVDLGKTTGNISERNIAGVSSDGSILAGSAPHGGWEKTAFIQKLN